MLVKGHAIKILIFYMLKLKRSHCASTDYIVCKTSNFKITSHSVNNMNYCLLKFNNTLLNEIAFYFDNFNHSRDHSLIIIFNLL